MIDDEPTLKDMIRLWKLCAKFIEDQKIRTEECIYQCDWVIENAYDFMYDICEEVGYFEDGEDPDDDFQT